MTKFLKDLYHGTGTEVDADGALYEGEWRVGKFHGVGKHTGSNFTYKGDFLAGLRH